MAVLPAVIEGGSTPKLSKIIIERCRGSHPPARCFGDVSVRRFNGIPFPEKIPVWTAWLHMLNDPVEYSLTLEAPSQLLAHARTLLILR